MGFLDTFKMGAEALGTAVSKLKGTHGLGPAPRPPRPRPAEVPLKPGQRRFVPGQIPDPDQGGIGPNAVQKDPGWSRQYDAYQKSLDATMAPRGMIDLPPIDAPGPATSPAPPRQGPGPKTAATAYALDRNSLKFPTLAAPKPIATPTGAAGHPRPLDKQASPGPANSATGPSLNDPGWKRNSGQEMKPGPPGLVPTPNSRRAGTPASPMMASGSGANKGFFETNMPTGVAQNLGMAALGGGLGGVSAWAFGGDVKTGIGLGAMTGGLGAHYSGAMQDAWKGAQMAGHRMRANRGLTARSAAKKMPGGATKDAAMTSARSETAAGRAGMRNVHNQTSNTWRAAAVAGGAGLASGTIFSGHRRKPVNRYNSTRGNYI